MMTRILFTLCPLVAASSLLMACAIEPADEGADLGAARLEVEIANALTQNALTQNALTQNALTQNALTQNALTQNALTQNALTQNALVLGAMTDPNSRELFKYVVSCALPAGQQITLTIGGVVYSFQGQLGLAGEWGHAGGQCSPTCQGWVSACVLSRVNYLGVPVDISLRGEQAKLKTSPTERGTYPMPEAAYYGNIFTSPQKRYACTAPGSTLISRVCGPNYLSGCVMTLVDDCDDACSSRSSQDGHFRICHGSAQLPNGAYPPETEVFAASVTVFRQ